MKISHNNNNIIFFGDVFPYREFKKKIEHKIPFIFNLEAPITEHKKPIEGKINIRASRHYLESLFDPMPVAVSIANNHILDFGNEGFEDTLNTLRDMGIGFFGAGTRQENYNNPLIIEINAIKIGLLGYCYEGFYDEISKDAGLNYGPAPLNLRKILYDIKQTRKMVDRVVVHLHWGIINSNFPSKEEVIVARKIANNHADIIIGHHSHTTQPVETINDSTIAYNIGNYVFPDLDLPTYFNKAGIATKRKINKQRRWNRTSAGIQYDLSSKKVLIKYYYSKNDYTYEKKKYYHKYLSYNIPEDLNRLGLMIEDNLKIKRLTRLFLGFIKRPRIPSRESWNTLINRAEDKT